MADQTQPFDAVARVLARQPGSSMQEIAGGAGISRTTLHRAFGNREALVERLSEHVLADCERLFDEAGIDDAPVLEAFDRLLDPTLPLAKAYALLFAEPASTACRGSSTRSGPGRAASSASSRAARPPAPSAATCRRAGSSTRSAPSSTAIWWAVEDGYVGARDAAAPGARDRARRHRRARHSEGPRAPPKRPEPELPPSAGRWTVLAVICAARARRRDRRHGAARRRAGDDRGPAAVGRSALLWIIDIYPLVVAPLLVASGALGDRLRPQADAAGRPRRLRRSPRRSPRSPGRPAS